MILGHLVTHELGVLPHYFRPIIVVEAVDIHVVHRHSISLLLHLRVWLPVHLLHEGSKNCVSCVVSSLCLLLIKHAKLCIRHLHIIEKVVVHINLRVRLILKHLKCCLFLSLLGCDSVCMLRLLSSHWIYDMISACTTFGFVSFRAS